MTEEVLIASALREQLELAHVSICSLYVASFNWR